MLLALPYLTGCSWYVTEAYRREVSDRDHDGFLAAEVGGRDCKDDNPAIHPNAAEICGDGLDNDCSGTEDDDGVVGTVTWYEDVDGDGYGKTEVPREACPGALGAGWVTLGGDCDDRSTEVNPGEDDVCGDGMDNDCDGTADNAPGVWEDLDGDGFGDPEAAGTCDGLLRPVANDLDCDDTDAEIRPGAVDICDGVDNDCNGASDDNGAVASVEDVLFGSVDKAIAEALAPTTVSVVRVCAGTHTLSPHRIESVHELTIVGVSQNVVMQAEFAELFDVRGSLTLQSLTLTDEYVSIGDPILTARDGGEFLLLDVRVEDAIGVAVVDGSMYAEATHFVDTLDMSAIYIVNGTVTLRGGSIDGSRGIGVVLSDALGNTPVLDSREVDWGSSRTTDIEIGSRRYDRTGVVWQLVCDRDGC